MNGIEVPVDSSTLIHLARVEGGLKSARLVAGLLLVGPGVWFETVVQGEARGRTDPVRIRVALEQGWLARKDLDRSMRREAEHIAKRFRLGTGESEALALAPAGGVVLVDERPATLAADVLGRVPVPSLMVPVLGAIQRRLAVGEARRLLRRLAAVTGARAVDLIRLEALLKEVAG